MKRFRKVLLPLDVMGAGFGKGQQLTTEQRVALREARWLHENFGSELTLLAVVESEDTPAVRDAALALLRRGVESELGGVPVQYAVAVGTPFIEIIRHVLRGGIDLVVVPSRRPTLLERAIVGSTSLRLMRKCPCAVWVTGRRPVMGPLVVLAALGSSGLRAAILDNSASLVKARGGEWHVLHCVEYIEEAGMRLQHAEQEQIDAYRKRTREEAWRALEMQTAEIGGTWGLKPVLWLAQGDPAHEIVDAAQRQDVDVVVMGTIGRAGLPGVLIGNTAEKVLKHVDCGVIALKPKGYVSPITLEG